MKRGKGRGRGKKKGKKEREERGERGERKARTRGAAAPGEDGKGDGTVTREYDSMDDARGFRIVASGHDAAFLEFGTGVMTTVTRPTVQADFDISDGSWSREVLASNEPGGEYARFGDYWHWNGQHWTGTPPIGAMQEACNAMEQWSPTIAGRVFG